MTVSSFNWREGSLLDAALDIYTENFYPEPKRGTHRRAIWYAIVQVAPQQTKVIVASGLELNKVRIMSGQLAISCIQDECKALSYDAAALDIICENIRI
jgi:hypothetical protein